MPNLELLDDSEDDIVALPQRDLGPYEISRSTRKRHRSETEEVERHVDADANLDHTEAPAQPRPVADADLSAKRFHTKRIDMRLRQLLRRRARQRPIDIVTSAELVIEQPGGAHRGGWIGQSIERHGPDGCGELTEWYEAVRLRGVEYKVGDGARVELKGGAHQLAIIRGISKKWNPAEAGVKLQWLQDPSSESLAWKDDGELFLQSACDDVMLDNISERFVVHAHRPSGKERLETGAAFAAVPDCDACHTYRQRTSKNLYHRHDFVLVDSGVGGSLFGIGHVLEAFRDALAVRWLGRVRGLPGVPPGRFDDPKELYVEDKESKVSLDSVRGRCLVLPESTDDPHVFHCGQRLPAGKTSFRDLVSLQRPLPRCTLCHDDRRQEQRDVEAFQRMGGLPSVDLYAGGGGTMRGKQGWFCSVLAVDLDETACRTLESNFPDVKVQCTTIEALLIAAMNRDAGKTVHPVRDERGGRHCAPFPERGSIVLLSASPPCQGHSGLNRHKKADDPLNEETFKVLSEVDRLRPDFFLLENVPGMTFSRADGSLHKDAGKSYADFATKLLIDIGYQVRSGILDAASYGAPAYRQRLFLLAARRGVPLPHFPQPTHVNARWRTPGLDEDGRHMFDRSPGSAAFPAVTARMATDDLPPWEYAGRPAPGAISSRGRGVTGAIPAFDASHATVGYDRAAAYASPPRNVYQQIKRGNQPRTVRHYTGAVGETSLRGVFQAEGYIGEKGAQSATDAVLRANPDQPLRTLVTTISVGGKNQGVVHWSGFPDEYILCGTPDQQNKQIGNAVNVDQASAIFGQIVREVVLPVWRDAGRPRSSEDFARAWRARYPLDMP